MDLDLIRYIIITDDGPHVVEKDCLNGSFPTHSTCSFSSPKRILVTELLFFFYLLLPRLSWCGFSSEHSTLYSNRGNACIHHSEA